jgi:hypothetical protein
MARLTETMTKGMEAKMKRKAKIRQENQQEWALMTNHDPIGDSKHSLIRHIDHILGCAESSCTLCDLGPS